MYPDTDLCSFPEAVCASKHSNELRWVVGMFYWIQQVQSFDNQDGWNYMDKLEDLSKDILSSSEDDDSARSTLLMAVDCILKTGSVDCDSGEDMANRLEKVLGLITKLDLPTPSPTTTISPSTSPTEVPTGR